MAPDPPDLLHTSPQECAEQCCHPRSGPDGQRNENSCKLKTGAECSPSVGPCCTDQCSFIPASHRQQCKEEQVRRLLWLPGIVLILVASKPSPGPPASHPPLWQDCTEKSFCNGRAAVCPRADTKEDNRTECNGGTQVQCNLLGVHLEDDVQMEG